MQHWHEYNPHRNVLVYCSIEELAACAAGGKIRVDGKIVDYTPELVLNQWSKISDKLDAYILPNHTPVVRFGPRPEDVLVPYVPEPSRVRKILSKTRVRPIDLPRLPIRRVIEVEDTVQSVGS